MAQKDLKEFTADHEGGDVVQGGVLPDPIDAVGGPIAPRLADAPVEAEEADENEVITPGNAKVDVEVTESFDALFEGLNLSEAFKGKVSLVFEAAVNEAVTAKTSTIAEQLEEEFKTKLEEATEASSARLAEEVENAVEGIVENLDAYLDYVVEEWMSENKIAIEAGIKVEMAESLMNSLKTAFYEHNIEIDEDTIDVVAGLEEQVDSLKAKANEAINENLDLIEEIKSLRASVAFNEISEGLTTSQTERFRVLSEKLNYEDAASYKEDLITLKESFFKSKAPMIKEEAEDMLIEDTSESKRIVSQYDSVNALAAAISSIKTK